MKQKKKNIKVKIIIFLLIILITIFIMFLVFKKNNNLIVDMVDSVVIELYEEYYNIDGVINVTNGEIVSHKEKIDSSKIGSKEVIIKIMDKYNKEKEYSYVINIIDKEAPQIEYKDKIEMYEGDKVNLLDGVVVNDNSNEEIEAIIEGEYDLNNVGEYNLFYVAKDSSGNESRESFVLVVKKKKNSSSNNIDNNSNNIVYNNDDKSFTTSKGFNGYVKNGITYIDGILIANKTYSLPSSYTGGSSTKGLTVETYDAFVKMQQAAANDGINIFVQSGYRSYETQKRLYNNYVARDGKAAADTYSARPGNSEHQTGLGFDICSNNVVDGCINDLFNNTTPANWLSDNAYKYGFILRYPKGKSDETGYKYESWHFRYVGIDLATKLYNNGNWITLESYFGITSKYND